MKSLSRKVRLSGGFLSVALVSLATSSLSAQGAWPQDGGYGQQYPQPQYTQPQYPQPQYQQPQYSQPQYSQPQTYADDQGYAPQPQTGYAPQGAGMSAISPGQLEQLVAPVALYPDALLAQILAGSTYPAQLAAADQWVRSMGYATPDQMAAAANAQTMWDPSIKALTAYPQVLDMLAGNLQWATALGNAYYNQPQDVLQTVQVMRMRAQQAGTLVSTPQMQVVQNPGYIALQPVNPNVVYVPTYNPWMSYGAPVQPYPGFSFTGILSTLANAFVGGAFGHGGYGVGGFAGGSGLQFLTSFALGAFNRTPFGLIAWGLDWLVNALTFHHSDYYTHSTSVRDWGLPHGGPRYFPRAYPAERAGLGGSYHHEPIPVHGGAGFGGDRFAGNAMRPQSPVGQGWMGQARTGEGRTSQGWMNRPEQPAFARNDPRPALPPQQVFNRAPEPARPDWNTRSDWNRGPVANGFAPRTAAPQPMRPAYPTYSGGYGNTSRPGNLAYAPTPSFKQEDRGGFHMFGGGRESNGWSGGSNYKEPKSSFKEPRMQSYKEPKFKEPKMPKMKAPHESHSSGGHGGGGGHHHFL